MYHKHRTSIKGFKSSVVWNIPQYDKKITNGHFVSIRASDICPNLAVKSMQFYQTYFNIEFTPTGVATVLKTVLLLNQIPQTPKHDYLNMWCINVCPNFLCLKNLTTTCLHWSIFRQNERIAILNTKNDPGLSSITLRPLGKYNVRFAVILSYYSTV